MEIDFDVIYRDQAMFGVSQPGFHMLSAYTPEGIKRIDSQYVHLILNSHKTIKQIYWLDRRGAKSCDVKTRKESTSCLRCYDFWEPISLAEAGEYDTLKVEWEGGYSHVFHYYRMPKVNLKTQKICVVDLRKSIRTNPHLHQVIKDNLLSNLEALKIIEK